jgi:hypothetical protein
MVSRLDRLARSTRDLLNLLHGLAEKGAKFKSMGAIHGVVRRGRQVESCYCWFFSESVFWN